MTKPGDPTRSTGDERDRALARLEKALRESLQRSEAAESLLDDQRQRLKSLGLGREESMRALAEAREELQRVSRERDELRKKLSRIDSMQTETIALPDDYRGLSGSGAVPSLDDLMSALGEIKETRENRVAGHLHQRVQSAANVERSEEMLSPELVFPEKFAATAESAEHQAPASRILVLMDSERPVKYPLFKETMTLGRADVADIHINNDFLSRLHARFVSTPNTVAIEDIESKNGIRVNAKLVTRQELHHGDVIDLGRLRFRFIDTSADELE
jgi:FHA domain